MPHLRAFDEPNRGKIDRNKHYNFREQVHVRRLTASFFQWKKKYVFDHARRSKILFVLSLKKHYKKWSKQAGTPDPEILLFPTSSEKKYDVP